MNKLVISLVKDNHKIDITQFSNTIPNSFPYEIDREHIIKNIEETFSVITNNVILIEGLNVTGKSTLLAQFARKHRSNTVSVFIGEDFWKSDIDFILSELCIQMSKICSESLKTHLENIDIEGLLKHDLVILFRKLYNDLGKQARRTGKIFYIVIDGLDKITNNIDEDSFLQYIPQGDAAGVYVLLSSLKGNDYTFEYYPMQISFFSRLETGILLQDFLNKEEIDYVYNVSDGMPGYIGEIHRQLGNSIPKEEVINNLPPSFQVLLEKTWSQQDVKDKDLIRLISLITYSIEPIQFNDIPRILNISEHRLAEYIDEVSFLTLKENKVELLSAFKVFFKGKLVAEKVDIIQDLISFYETNTDPNAILYLPELYQEQKEFKSLKNLLDIENIYKIVQSTQKMSIVRKHLRILSNMAYSNKDWNSLSWSSLTESVFTQIANTPPGIENQVKALLSLNTYEEALRLAFLCVLPEDRLILLSYICRYMKQHNIEISKDILSSLEESISLIDNTVDISDELIEKLIDICSNIFSVDSSLSLKLVEQVVSRTGEHVEKDKLMDYLMLRLLLKVDKENEDIEEIKNNIGNNDLQNFIIATSDLIEEDISEVFRKVETMNDVSAKLFYLQNWGEKNSTHNELNRVVEFALNIMTESNDYTPTIKNLREFAELLISSTDEKLTKKLITTIENILSTLIKSPMDELARLELTLFKIEFKWPEDTTIERFYSVFVGLDDVKDYDGKCLVLIHLLETHVLLLDEDKKVYTELRDQLIKEFNRLITSSADHFSVSKKIISRLTKLDKSLAYNFAMKLNTRERTNKALAVLLDAHLNNPEVDFDFFHDTLEHIDDKPYKDWIFVRLLSKLVTLKTSVPHEFKSQFFGKIKVIDSVVGKTLAFGHYINLENNEKKIGSAFNELLVNLSKIDDTNQKKDLGFKLVKILSDKHKSLAQEIYKITLSNYKQNNIFDTRLSQLFSEVIELLIRMIPDVIKSEDSRFKIKHIKNMVLSIPSSYQQCTLLSSLALRCLVNGKREITLELAEKCIEIAEKSMDDIDSYNKIITEIAPLLYEYESNEFFEKVNRLNSIVFKEEAIRNTIRFIISKRPSSDPIDSKSLKQKIDYPDSVKICNLIENLDTDSNIYSMIKLLVDALIEKSSNQKYKSKLKEKQLLQIAEKIISIIENKLPDKNNIMHEGYKIASFGEISKLRDLASHRATRRWETLFPTRQQLKERALNIPNTSDKIFVLASLGTSAYFTDQNLGITFIKAAEEHLKYLNNPLDRAERYEMVAESYRETSNDKAAKFLLEQAMQFAKACSHEQGRDQIISGLIDLAHSIDPTLAQSYATSLDSTSASFLNLTERLTTLSLHSDPNKIHNYTKEETDRVLYDYFNKVLRSVCSGRGTILHEDVIGTYLNHSIGQSFPTITLGISWYIENSISRNKGLTSSDLNELFMGVFQLLELIKNVEVSMYDNTAALSTENFYKVITETNIHTFDLSEQEEAFLLIKKWIKNDTNTYLKVYDPYFNEEMLELLMHTGLDTRVFIYTAAKTNELEELPNKYKSYWSQICDNVPPETHLYIYATNNGETPLHDRFIIGENSGLKLGTSLNGFGSKFSTITFLEIDEKEKVEREFITPLLTMPPTQYKDQRLIMKIFSLN